MLNRINYMFKTIPRKILRSLLHLHEAQQYVEQPV